MHPPVPQPASGPVLRLFSPAAEQAAGEPPLSADCTLSEFFLRHVRPLSLTGAAPATLKLYGESLAWWARLTGDPPLAQIDDFSCAEFVRRLLASGLASNTAHKHVRNLAVIFRRSGPRSLCREGAGLLAEPPHLPRPRLEINEVEDCFSVAEIGLWMEACAAHDQRRANRRRQALGCQRADWHRRLIVAGYNLGLRLAGLLAIRRDWLCQDELGWWLVIPAAASKIRRRQRVYVNRPALAALEAQPAGERFFEWPYGVHYLQELRRRQQAASELAPHRRLGYHALRKACATELAAINPAAAKMQLGHSGRDVTLSHYLTHRLLAEAAEQLPQPQPRLSADRQRRLFD